MMIAMVATDNQRGLANEAGIPWKLPTDTKYYKDIIKDKTIAMGKVTYLTHPEPMSPCPNYVLTDETEVYKGYTPITDVSVLVKVPEDVWVIGGAYVFSEVLPHLGTIYRTRVDSDFNCTKFFPEFEDDFVCVDPGVKQTENGLDFYWEIWERK